MSVDKKLSDKSISARDREILRMAQVRKEKGAKPLLSRAAMFAEVDKDEKNFHYYGFNDVGGQIKKAIDMGYEPVVDEQGNIVKEFVSKSDGTQCILMKIPRDLYIKRQKAKSMLAKDMEESIKHKQVDEKVEVTHERVIDNS